MDGNRDSHARLKDCHKPREPMKYFDTPTEGGENRDKMKMDSDFKVLTNETGAACPSVKLKSDVS